ncbi:MAG: hypothetical protein HKN37_04620 [Rhodothermales bacterium]|nr:hypothetical protein [Rhodothermales bacterium]
MDRTRQKQKPADPAPIESDPQRELRFEADPVEVPSADATEQTFDPSGAEEVWRIAARLQADAARRLEERSRSIADSPTVDADSHRFTLSEVKAIGDEAGIDPQYIELALRKQAADQHVPQAVSGKMSDTAGRFLATPEEHLSVTRVIRAGKQQVLDAMQRVFPSEPYHLQLLEVIGDETALADSTMIFKVPQVEMAVSTSGINVFAYHMSIADLNRMTVTLHSIDEERTEVSIQLDLKYGKWRNFKVGSWITGIFGSAIGFLVFVVGLKKMALGLMGVAGIAAMTGLILGYGIYWGYRLAYRSGIRKGQREITDLLAQVDVTARTGGGFQGWTGEG